MKKEDVEIIGETIVLGVFHTDTFAYFCKKALYFDQFADWIDEYNNMYDIVENACERANRIIFILDKVHFPIDPEKSITCMELKIVCDNEEFFSKTVFVKGDNVIDFDKNLL